MLLNRFHLLMPIYAITALITSFVAYGQPPVKFQEKTGGTIEVPMDIVKKIKVLDNQIQDLGGYGSLTTEESEAIPIPEPVSTVEFKKIIEILSAAKKTLGIEDLSKVSEMDLQNAVEKNINIASPNDLLEILTAANFLDVKSILNAGAKIFAKNYSGRTSNFYSLIPEVKQLIIENMSPRQFIALVNSNFQGVNNPKEEDLFKMALKIHAKLTAPAGKSAKLYYEANWHHFHKMLRVGECYHFKIKVAPDASFLQSGNYFSYQNRKPERVCIVGTLPHKIGFKIDTNSGEKFLSAMPDGSVKLVPHFEPSETFSIMGYIDGKPIIKTAQDTYLMADCVTVSAGVYGNCTWKQRKEAKEISYGLLRQDKIKFIEAVPVK